MLNALKTPSPGNFRNEVDEPGKEKIFKYKKHFFVLFFILLIVAVFSLYPNPEEEFSSSKKSLEKPLAPLSDEQKTEPLPAQNKPEPTKQDPASEPVQNEPAQSKLSFKDDKKEFSFKNDKEYLAMNRFERPLSEAKNPVITRESVRDTVAVVDKPLALAGRGFDIKGFQSHSRAGLQADFLRHLKRPVPKMERIPPDHLDLQLTQVKNSKHLIFHPLRPALSVLKKPAQQKNAELQPKKPQALQAIPETKLLFNESEKSDLLLRSGQESLDLLIGNEKINRKKYGSW